jgi:hypothetical protein
VSEYPYFALRESSPVPLQDIYNTRLFFILVDQYDMCFRWLEGASCPHPMPQTEFYSELRPFSDLTSDRDITAQSGYKLRCNRQSRPVPPNSRRYPPTCLFEGFEDLIEVLNGYTFAVVL